jgi:hypothetical protein
MIRYIAVFAFLLIMGTCSYACVNPGPPLR